MADGSNQDAYVRNVVDLLFADMDETTRGKLSSDILTSAPLTLGDEQKVLGSLPPEQAKQLRNLSAQLDTNCRLYLPLLNEEIAETYISFAQNADDASRPVPVVWVRKSNRATVQFAFPRLKLSISEGTVHRDTVQTAPLPYQPLMMMFIATPDARDVLGGVVQLASSVSWALPPPWGAVATGALTILQMLLGATAPEKPSPFDTMRDQLEEFIKQEELNKDADAFKNFANNLFDLAAGMDWEPENTTDVNVVQIDNLIKFLDDNSIGIGEIHKKCTSLVNGLEGKKLDTVKTQIDLAVTGITLLLTGHKIYMQLLATRASYAAKIKDNASYNIYTAEWIARLKYIRASFGIDNSTQGDLWIKTISDCINYITVDRLGKISDVKRSTKTVYEYLQGEYTGYSVPTQQAGCSWRDTAEDSNTDNPSDEDIFRHFYADTTEGGDPCHDGHAVTHEGQANTDLAAHKQSVCVDIDKILGTARDSVNGWKDSLDSIAKMMPPSAPTWKPIAVALPGGPTTPQGIDWCEGNEVSFAAEYINEKGPSGYGPWSDPITVGKTAYATVSGFRACPEDSTAVLRLYRQWITPTSNQPVIRMVTASVPPGSGEFQDEKTFQK